MDHVNGIFDMLAFIGSCFCTQLILASYCKCEMVGGRLLMYAQHQTILDRMHLRIILPRILSSNVILISGTPGIWKLDDTPHVIAENLYYCIRLKS